MHWTISVLALTAALASPAAADVFAGYWCDDGRAVTAFYTDNPDAVWLGSATGTMTLPRARSASGSRYANEAEDVVWWIKGGEARLEMPDGTVTCQVTD